MTINSIKFTKEQPNYSHDNQTQTCPTSSKHGAIKYSPKLTRNTINTEIRWNNLLDKTTGSIVMKYRSKELKRDHKFNTVSTKNSEKPSERLGCLRKSRALSFFISHKPLPERNWPITGKLNCQSNARILCQWK